MGLYIYGAEVKMTTTIIGAGPAGCYAAWKLVKKGIPVKVIEEHDKVGLPLQCTGLVSDNLEKAIKFPKDIIINKIKYAKFFWCDFAIEPI